MIVEEYSGFAEPKIRQGDVEVWNIHLASIQYTLNPPSISRNSMSQAFKVSLATREDGNPALYSRLAK